MAIPSLSFLLLLYGIVSPLVAKNINDILSKNEYEDKSGAPVLPAAMSSSGQFKVEALAEAAPTSSSGEASTNTNPQDKNPFDSIQLEKKFPGSGGLYRQKPDSESSMKTATNIFQKLSDINKFTTLKNVALGGSSSNYPVSPESSMKTALNLLNKPSESNVKFTTLENVPLGGSTVNYPAKSSITPDKSARFDLVPMNPLPEINPRYENLLKLLLLNAEQESKLSLSSTIKASTVSVPAVASSKSSGAETSFGVSSFLAVPSTKALGNRPDSFFEELLKGEKPTRLRASVEPAFEKTGTTLVDRATRASLEAGSSPSDKASSTNLLASSKSPSDNMMTPSQTKPSLEKMLIGLNQEIVSSAALGTKTSPGSTTKSGKSTTQPSGIILQFAQLALSTFVSKIRAPLKSDVTSPQSITSPISKSPGVNFSTNSPKGDAGQALKALYSGTPVISTSGSLVSKPSR